MGSPQVTLEQLRKRLDEARIAYNAAADEAKKRMDLCRDLGPGHADGVHAMRQALAAENAARSKYKQALDAYTDRPLNGSLP